MPDRGLLVVADSSPGPIAIHAEGDSWTLSGVTLAQVTFEVPRDAALAHLPEDVGRPVPCYARLIIVDAAASPAGPLRLAALLVGGRHQLMPRNVLVEGVVQGLAPTVAAALGSQFRPGRIALERDDSHLTVEVSDDERTLVRAHWPALKAVDPTMLRWDPWLGLADLDGVVRLTEMSLRPRAREAFLTKGASVTADPGLARSHRWRQLRNLNTVSACVLEGDLEIVLPRATAS